MSIYFKAHASPKPHSAPPTADFRSRCINIHSEFLNGTRGSDRACHLICRATQPPSVSTQKKESSVLPSSLFLIPEIPGAQNRTAALPAVPKSRPVIKSRRRVVARAVIIRVRRVGIRPPIIRVSPLRRGGIVTLRNRPERQQ